MDLTPLIPAGRQIIESYGDGRFRISGRVIEGSALVFPDRTLAWPVAAIDQLTDQSLEPVFTGSLELLLLGCGSRMAPVAPALRQRLRAAGIVLETMDTGAACRTYNVLMSEGRRVAAALIAVS